MDLFILRRGLIYQTHIFDHINKYIDLMNKIHKNKVGLMNQAPTHESNPYKNCNIDEYNPYILLF